jgi:hypothetical protein
MALATRDAPVEQDVEPVCVTTPGTVLGTATYISPEQFAWTMAVVAVDCMRGKLGHWRGSRAARGTQAADFAGKSPGAWGWKITHEKSWKPAMRMLRLAPVAEFSSAAVDSSVPRVHRPVHSPLDQQVLIGSPLP